MKIKRQLSHAQVQRLKFQCLITLTGLCFAFLTTHLVEAQGFQGLLTQEDAVPLRPDFEGPYVWQGQEMGSYMRIERGTGYIDQYTNADHFCQSPLILPGFYLMGEGVIGLFLIIALFYLFIGVNVLSDIFSDAIYQITSKTEDVEIYEESEKGLKTTVGVPIWNAQVAYVTIMALGCSAPEIFLCMYGQFRTESSEDTLPSTMGPMILVGSASLNLFVGGGLAILGASQAKKVEACGAYAVTACFGTFAYIWLYIVICINTPYYIDIGEAILTLMFYLILVLSVYATERCVNTRSEAEERDANRRRICRHQLQLWAREKGKLHMLEAATGYYNDEQAIQIQEYFKIVLEVENLNQVSIDDLVDALEPENPIQRLGYRKKINIRKYMGFTNANTKTLHSGWHENGDQRNPIIGFSHNQYSVNEAQEHVIIKIEKRVDHDFSFLLVTHDDTAEAGLDYKPKRELMTMKAKEMEREVAIAIIDNPEVEPDEQFHVLLLDELTSQPLAGVDTKATVTIVDNDDPGWLGFTQDSYQVNPKLDQVKVTVRRNGGAAGEVTCFLRIENSVEDPHEEEDYGIPRAEIDVEPIQVSFYDGQEQAEVMIPIVPSADETINEHFRVVLCEPQPEDIRLSMRNYCVVNIKRSEAEMLYSVRSNFIHQYMAHNRPSWFGQFKQSLMLGPVVDEYEQLDNVTCWEALVHLCTMPWRFVFSIIPPKHYFGGWPTFFFTFFFIGVISFFIMELSSVIGCLLKVKTCVQALIFIAVGTSLPDLLTTYAAASYGKTAGPSLSILAAANAANVFIGLGLPWTIASIYQYRIDQQSLFIGRFEVADIAFVTVLFVIFSVFTFAVFGCRRMCVNGEIGGSQFCKAISACTLFLIWILFVFLAILNCYEQLPDREIMVPAFAVLATQVADCPNEFGRIDTFESDTYVTLNWSYPTTIGSPIIACDIQVQDAFGDYVPVKEYCNCRQEDIFNAQTCKIPHSFLNKDLSLPSCTSLQARGRLVGADGCTGAWSEVNENHVAKVHGCPLKYNLSYTSPGNSNSFNLNWDNLEQNNESSGCARIDHYELEHKLRYADGRNGNFYEPWTDIKGPDDLYQLTRYTYDDPGFCADHKFRSRGVNSWCEGKYSDDLDIISAGCPAPAIEPKPALSQVQATYEGCSIRFSWVKPTFSRNDIIRYNIQVQNQSGQWQTVNQCGQNSGQFSCSVQMSTFQQSPYFLQSGEFINVRGNAESSSLGAGAWSFGNSQVQILGTPTPPILTNFGDTLSWNGNAGTDGILSYEIWRSIGDQEYIMIDSTTTSSYLLSNDLNQSSNQSSSSFSTQWGRGVQSSQGSSHSDGSTCFHCSQRERGGGTTATVDSRERCYKVKAKSQCGVSQYSNSSCVNQQAVPGIVTGFTMSLNQCSLRMSWNEPDNNGAPITEYKIDFKSRSGVFVPYTGCSNASITACSIEMHEFSGSTFNMIAGSGIVARISARNEVGFGPTTNEIDQNISVIGSPPPMRQPVINDSQNSSTITISWSSPASSGLNQISGYTLFNYQQQIYTGLDTSFTMTIQQGQQYSFRVSSRNSCGAGQPSPYVPYQSLPPTCSMDPVYVQSGNCQASLSWSTPRCDLTNYQLQIKDSRQQWQLITESCPTNAGSGSACTLPMSILMASPYNLQVGANIQARVRAQNIAGWGQWSSDSRSSARVQGGPSTPPTPFASQPTGNSVAIGWGSTVQGQSTEVFWDGSNNQMQRLVVIPTGQSSYTISNISSDFSFKIRYINECGPGPFSRSVPVEFSKPPGQVSTVTTALVDCSVRINWQAPVSDSSIQTYNTQVQATDGRWYAIDNCGSSGQTQCVLSMSVFTQRPFYLTQGQIVKVKVAAQNQDGSGPYSIPNSIGATIASAPVMLSKPTLSESSMNSATFTWNNVSGVSYEIYGTEPNSGTFYRLYESNYASYTVQNLIPGSTYRYKVRAKNSCGLGPYSPEIIIQMQGVPDKMQPVRATTDGCQVLFRWTAPNSNGLQINDYVFKVASSQNVLYEIDACGSSFSESCTVQMSTLAAAPFNLVPGSTIYSTVAACNQVGCGQNSDYNQGVAMTGNPSAVQNLAYINSPSSSSSVVLSWSAASGGVSQYEIWQSSNGGQWSVVAQVQSGQTSTTIAGLSSGVTYCFKVRASSSCGQGNYSNEITFSLAGLPGPMSALRTSLQNCNLQISWSAPYETGGGAITNYAIYIYAGNTWRALNQCNPGSSTSCTVSLPSLQQGSYNLRAGDYIRVKGKAQNAQGYGGFSPESSFSVQIPDTHAEPFLKLTLMTHEMVTIEWTHVLQGQLTRGGANRYEVYWDQGLGNDNFILKDTVFTNNYTISTSQEIKHAQNKFKIRVVSGCGQDVESNVLTVYWDLGLGLI